MKKLFTLIALMVLVSLGTVHSQTWVYQGAFPNASFALNNPGGHGVAVDPDGKIWIANYYAVTGDSIFNGTTKISSRAIHVYNPDGSEVSFSPIMTLTVGAVTDTFKTKVGAGLRTDMDGNILYTSQDRLFKIDYKTGQGLAMLVQPFGTKTMTAAAVDGDNNVYVATVVPGSPIRKYSSDLSQVLDEVTDVSVGYSRSFEVSADGNKVYWAGYDKHKVKIYSRPDLYSPYALTDSIMFGFDCESFTWSPDGKYLWASAGSYLNLPNQDPDHITAYTPGTWYAWDLDAGQIVDSIITIWPKPVPDAGYRPRGIAFSPDYQNAYLAYFGGTAPPFVKLTKTTLTSISVTFRVNMAVQVKKGAFNIGTDNVVVRGSFQAAAGDPGGDWQGSYFTMTKGANDTIYSVTATFPASEYGNSFEYKFVINSDGWESSANRPFTLNAASITLPVVFFNNENVYIPTVKNIVLFQADMSSYLGTGPGQFDPSKDSLVVMGLSNWGGYAVTSVEGNRTLSPSISDPTIYQALLTFRGPVGDSTAWKFKAYPDERFGNGGGYEVGENRYYHFVADSENTNVLAPVVPGLVIFAGELANSVNVLFQVNMSNAVDFFTKQLIPANTIDFVGLKGSIKPLGNWGGSWVFSDTTDAPTYVDTIRTLKPLNDQGLNGDKVAGDNVWSRTVTFPAGTPAGNTEFKFGMGYPGVEQNNSGSKYLDNEMAQNVNHVFFLKDGPTIELLANFGIQELVTGVVKDNNTIPNVYSLNQNYPNPFNPSTSIKYSVPSAQFVTLKVYNLLGQEVATLVNEVQNAGNYIARFDASSLSSGIYFYTLKAGNFTSTKKMILMK